MGAERKNQGKVPMKLLPAEVVDEVEAGHSVKLGRHTWNLWWDNRKEVSCVDLCSATKQFLRQIGHQSEDPYGGWGCVAQVFEAGATKYAANNWRQEPALKYSQLWDSIMRHRLDRDSYNPDFGLPSMWHEAWGYVVLLAYMLWGIGEDDRFQIEGS